VKVFDTSSMKRAEDAASDRGLPKLLMMESAGRATASVLRTLLDPSLRPSVLVVAGPGNNGGDGATAARHLQGDAKVTALLLGGRSKVKTEEASAEWKALASCSGVRILEIVNRDDLLEAKGSFDTSDAIIDAIFGTGVKGPIGEPYATAIKMINEARGLRISVDVPSGLDPDTGTDQGLVVRADLTVALHCAKPGLLKRPDVVGRLYVEEIGIPEGD
jgi:hydroxyethylthiazole kinase-like uncharacterized protein yjeF